MDTKTIIAGGVAAAVIVVGGVALTSDSPTNSQQAEPTNLAVTGEQFDNIPSDTRLAIVQDGVVVNTIEVPAGWTGEGKAEWKPPEGAEVFFSANAGIGDSWSKGKLSKAAPKEPPTVEELKAKENLSDEEQGRLIKYLIEQEAAK